MNCFTGRTAIVGIGQTPWYKRGTSPDPEMKLALRAIVAACEDAGLDPRDIDGFVSYGSEHNTGQKLLPGLGTRDLRFAALAWTHGGGIPGAIGIAASAIIAGQAEVVVVYRAMAEAKGGRLQDAVKQGDTPAQFVVNGIDMVTVRKGMRAQRMIDVDGVPASAFYEMARADYYHASRNPAAVANGKLLDADTYYQSRMIASPLRLYDCSRENDGAAAVILVSAERARDLRQTPAYVLSAPMGGGSRWGSREDNHEPYTSVGMDTMARRIREQTGYGAADIRVAQVYENFSAMGVAALIDFGFCAAAAAGEFFRMENLIAPGGRLAVNTAGGSLAEGFVHGIGLVPEAVRQIRGSSVNQVPDVGLSLMTGGPADSCTSAALFGSEETL